MSLHEVAPHSYELDDAHPLVKLLKKNYRWYSPKFSPRDVPVFADVSSVTESPETMKAIRDYLVARYKAMTPQPTHILGFDARGFLFGPMVAVELGIPFVLMRKAEKNAGLLIKSEPYDKEYKEAAPEVLTIRCGSIRKGSRVVLIDDVLATGGTALSGLQLVDASGAEVVEMVCVLAIPFLKGVEKVHSTANGRYKDVRFIAFLSDEKLTEENCGDVKDYSGPRVMSYGDAVNAHLS
ncbi:adenine phosphoribosyltransferase [Leptomonas pyrrhocoris]|uniref:adenine phosphoribosyltransferase n=1 Tax=Leptomonas pyrrhocoris TaxID=157538 RepID=A0A0M9GB38_LEPPY|nr:adenine phosphoribosyltransferase [Leptomonas pyrrhocoris]KPA86710.1 adenine phosphoribosyltransferase [Leptomonas pyrrhocoris]|eukprot:XP_015665149.1 adenine phosphoribosyltransferase [Leptomonas pyrrhocoris]